MNIRNLAFGKSNYQWAIISIIILVIGFTLMGGASSSMETFNPDIFDFRRVILAPGVCTFGFLLMIYAIVKKDKNDTI